MTWSPTLRLVLVATLAVSSAWSQTLREIGKFSVAHAAFLQIVNTGTSTHAAGQDTLVISTFNPIPLFHDTIYEVPAIGTHLGALSAVRAQEVTRDVSWPNEVNKVPDAVFNSPSYVIAAGGFLVPTKDKGSLTLFDLAVVPPTKHAITSSADSGWFYHRALWKDMNGDGLLDVVACRAQKHIFSTAHGQMVWFQNPGHSSALSHTWTSHVIDASGPDSFFILTSLPTPDGDVECIITAGYFSETLNVYWSTQANGRWDDASKIEKRVIDHSIGHVFDVKVVDLNVDGTLDLLVTNNAIRDASLFAFTVPADFRKDTFNRRTLATGFASRTSGQGKGAPGSPLVVYPKSTHTSSQKPLILLSGDDDGRAYLFEASSSDTADWSYAKTALLDVGSGTVGEMACADVDGDGYNEVFVPAYDAGQVHVFTFKP